ncbi:conjugal transfer protein TraG [Fusobacterium necrophorum]|uniref:Conjugal transfer protein TraG n=1 Tax=Fusobacterium necrophorum TaxID=859 RepID=A0A4Q2KX04_9FUSO|nr:type IV secretory system conjugative DNA transfer family protein [Fusobacterium necrophorum]RXZ68423.1 conjugal transfer protein TraG [Fusobacterium necrophorum]
MAKKRKLKPKQTFRIIRNIFVIGFFSSWVATQYLAHISFYQKALGQGLFYQNIYLYFPWKWYFWIEKFGAEIPKKMLFTTLSISILPPAILGYTYYLLIKPKNSGNYGTAKWADTQDIKDMNLSHKYGVVLGKSPYGSHPILRDNSDRHILMSAPTRMGKGINTVTPSALDWEGSVIFNDIKGELWDLTSGYRQKILGQKTLMFCPVDTEGVSCHFNPLDFISLGTYDEFGDVSMIAQTLIDTEGKGESDHWITSAINFITGVILHVKYSKENASLTDVVNFIASPNQPIQDTLADVLGIPREGEDGDEYEARTGKSLESGETSFNHLDRFENKNLLKELYQYEGSNQDINCWTHPLVAKEFTTLFSTPDKERGSIISTATQKLKIFLDPLIAKHIQTSDFTIKQLKEEKVSLYLVTPPKQLDRTKAIMRLILTEVVYGLTDRMKFGNKKLSWKEKIIKKIENWKKKITGFFFIDPSKNRILLLIDEFPSLGKLEIIEKSMAYIAGFGLKALLITQSLNQFRKIYGKDNYIQDNCSIQLYLTPNDMESAKMISEMLGKETVKTESRSRKATSFIGGTTISYGETGRELMTAGEVKILPYEEVIMFVTGQNPILGNKLFYYKENKYVQKLYDVPKKSDTLISFHKKQEENIEEENRKLFEEKERISRREEQHKQALLDRIQSEIYILQSLQKIHGTFGLEKNMEEELNLLYQKLQEVESGGRDSYYPDVLEDTRKVS